MGTRADFYVGQVWLGSLAFDGYRVHEMKEEHASSNEDSACCWAVKTATTELGYRDAVTKLLAINDDASLPAHGWPWPWKDSRTTDYAYVFNGSQTKCFAWGKEIVLGEDGKTTEGSEPESGWPDMTAVQNVVVGTKRDGVIIIGS